MPNPISSVMPVATAPAKLTMNSFSKNRTRRYQPSSLLRTQYHSAPNSRRERPTVRGGYRMCMVVIHAKSNRDRKTDRAPSCITKTPLLHRAQLPAQYLGVQRTTPTLYGHKCSYFSHTLYEYC